MFYSQKSRFSGFFMALLALVTFYACQDHRLAPSPQTLPDAPFYALTSNNQLLALNVRSTNTPTATVTISGLPQGEQILAIDFRPATGQLYGVGSSSRIYMINPVTGAATALGTGPFSPAINGNIVGLDFNPTVDRIRLLTNMGQNLRLHPETGAVAAIDGTINGAAGAVITGGAYTNNKAGVTTTTLYDIDPVTDKLYRQDPPNNGTLVEVGPLGLDITAVGGFDISPAGDAIVSVTFGGMTELDQVNLTTGRLQKLGDLPANVIGIAIPTEPTAYAIDNANNLLIFNPMNPAPITKAITGLQSGESVLGLDFRPANGQLYALGSTSRLYTVNTSNGAATVIGAAPFSPALSGTEFGFDFNPTVDRIRLTSNTGQNLRLHPDTGVVAVTDPNLNPGSPMVTASAYTNNFAGASTTTLYNIETTAGNAMLYIQNPPNNGTLVPVGSLGVTAESSNGFDIGGTSGMAYALLRSGGTTRVYSINLTTGAATGGATLPGNPTVRGMALGLGF
ncbi:MAG: DUF4394 domain-containing protein [Spirosomataceae bacterium]